MRSNYLAVSLAVCAFATMGCAPKEVNPPSIAGQSVPDKRFQLDFSKRYDILISFSYSGSFSNSDESFTQWLRSCKILGFTGEAPEEILSANAGFLSLQASSNHLYAKGGGRFFSGWLGLEYADGRRAFIPPGIVKIIEESAMQEQSDNQNSSQGSES